MAASVPRFCCPKWRAGSSSCIRLPSLGERRKSRASTKRVQVINQKSVLTISKPTFQFRCKAVSAITTMEVMPALADESLLTGEEAVVIAAAAEAVALARAAVEMAREAVLCFHTDPKIASETPSFDTSSASESVHGTPSFENLCASESVHGTPSFENLCASESVHGTPSFENSYASDSELDDFGLDSLDTSYASETVTDSFAPLFDASVPASDSVQSPLYPLEPASESVLALEAMLNSLCSINRAPRASDSALSSFPSASESALNHSSSSSESVRKPSSYASESVLNPSSYELESALNRFPSLRVSPLASKSAPHNPSTSPLASKSAPHNPNTSTLASKSAPHNPSPSTLASKSAPHNPSPSTLASKSAPHNPSPSTLASKSAPHNPSPSPLSSKSALRTPAPPPPASESALRSPFEGELTGIHEIPLGADVAVRVGSMRHTERRERRQRAAERAAARVLPARRRKVRREERDYKDPVKLFKRVAGSYKILTAAQEREMSQGVQDLLKLEAVQKQLTDRHGEEPSFELWAAACQLDQRTLHKRLDEGTLCRQTMVRSNIRLVISIAKHFIGAGLPFEDLVQEGCRGLVRGVEKFDGTKGFKFSTYAHWWIKQAIRRALSERSRLIQLPFNLVSASYRVKDAVKQLKGSGKTGRLSNDDIARVAGISKKTVQSVLTLPKAPISFDAMIGYDFNVKLSDTIACKEEDSPEYMFNKELTKSGLDMVLDTLNPREKQVVRWRYGLEDGRSKTLQEIGDTLSISRERVRQIESSAFRKLKSKKRVEMLQKYAD